MDSVAEIENRMASASASFAELKAEIGRVIVGNDALIQQIFIGEDADGQKPRRNP
jgi:hypothetical protein